VDDPLPSDLPQELLEEFDEPDWAMPSNLYQYVQSLKVADKVKLAMVGSKGARQLLIRDTNKVVSTAVIRSPKIREDEVQAIAQDRTVAEEILRIILTRKDWLKNYPIRLALAQNPKTPLPRALRLLDTLQERDLRQISRSRNVASAISAGATRILARRGKI
jgi:lipopolysaccharide biosynthesis protein